MKTLRQIHLYAGCIFAPLILYFALSGIWQTFGFNDIPKDETPTPVQSFFHEMSKPHTHSTSPGRDIKTSKSTPFLWVSALMGLGLASTTALGIILALRFTRRPFLVWCCLGAGAALPVVFLLL